MKKKYLFLLTIPALCLFSCNKNTKVTYRDNYTERFTKIKFPRRWFIQLLTAKYDDNGLPIEIVSIDPEYPDDPIATTTFEREFDDKHREIKYYEHFSSPDAENTYLVNRTYDNDFLIKEEIKESSLTPPSKQTTTSKKLYRKFTTNDKEGYSILALAITCTEREIGGIIDNASSINVSLNLSSYDKLERLTSSFTITIAITRADTENIYNISAPSIKISNIQYENDTNCSNSFYEIEYNIRTGKTTITEGYKTYSDKNLLLERKEVKDLQERTETYQYNYEYDDLDRMTSLATSEKITSTDGAIISEETNDATYSYVKDYTSPIKTIQHQFTKSEDKSKSVDSTTTREFDDYGRVLSLHSDVISKTIIENSTEITETITDASSKYGDPIIVPDDEILIDPLYLE
ncbi:MAG: hypothetical protein MJ208_02265 [Bacilli bacterium]|nr:hypothetical protein [Bacilli bacterium]